MNVDGTSKDSLRRNFVVILTVAIGLAFLAMVAGFLDALFMAVVFSGVVYPLYRWLSDKLGNRRSLASILTLVVSVLVVLIPLIAVLGVVADQAGLVVTKATPLIEKQLQGSSWSEVKLPSWFPFASELEPYTESIMAKLAEFAHMIGGFLASGLARLSQGTATFFFEFFLMIYAMYFFLIHGPALVDAAMNYVPLRRSEQQELIDVGHSVSRATIKGTLIIGLVQGALGGLGFAVAGIDAPVFWGAVMAILSILPAIGTPVVWIPAVIYLLMSGQTVAGIGLLVWCAAVVGTIDNLLRPILVGRDTKMPDLLILISTLGGIRLFGVSGLILGPMLAALFMTVLAIFRRVFADSLDYPDQKPKPPIR